MSQSVSISARAVAEARITIKKVVIIFIDVIYNIQAEIGRAGAVKESRGAGCGWMLSSFTFTKEKQPLRDSGFSTAGMRVRGSDPDYLDA